MSQIYYAPFPCIGQPIKTWIPNLEIDLFLYGARLNVRAIAIKSPEAILYIEGEYTPSPLTNRQSNAFKGGGAPALQLPAPAWHRCARSSLPAPPPLSRHAPSKTTATATPLARIAVATFLISYACAIQSCPLSTFAICSHAVCSLLSDTSHFSLCNGVYRSRARSPATYPQGATAPSPRSDHTNKSDPVPLSFPSLSPLFPLSSSPLPPAPQTEGVSQP